VSKEEPPKKKEKGCQKGEKIRERTIEVVGDATEETKEHVRRRKRKSEKERGRKEKGGRKTRGGETERQSVIARAQGWMVASSSITKRRANHRICCGIAAEWPRASQWRRFT
jgi:hypothetical protein